VVAVAQLQQSPSLSPPSTQQWWSSSVATTTMWCHNNSSGGTMRKCKVADLMQGRKRQTWCEEDDTHEQWRTRSAVAGSREKKKKFVDNTNLFGSGYHKTGV